MPLGELNINGLDAYEHYHLSLTDGGKAELMTPAPNKDRAHNSSRLRHGQEIASAIERKDKREIALPMHITARTSVQGLAYYNAFCAVLDAGTVNIELSSLPNVMFRCKYLSCSNFTEFRNQMFRFTLKLEEPNPANRSVPSSDSSE